MFCSPGPAAKVPVVTTITDLLRQIERAYDAIPRAGGARATAVGPFELFLRDGPGWPYYARPRLEATEITPADVLAVRTRQRELGVPEAIEWVLEVTPSALAAVRAGGLPVIQAPLMVLDPTRLPAATELAAAELTILDPDAAEIAHLLAVSAAVAGVGFGAGGTDVGPAGPAERDTAVMPADPDRLAATLRSLRLGRTAEAIARTPGEGVVARGAYQGAVVDGTGAAEIVGVATVPSARRRGLGAAVSALLARHALDHGYDLVFLSAANEDVARVYARIGFTRIGTAGIAEAPPP